MAELLYLMRLIGDFSQNTFFGMTRGFGQAEATISARSNGTFERFILDIIPSGAPNFPSGNTSGLLVTLDLLINGVVQINSRIIINSVGQTGTFLPTSQLAVPFLKDDDIVVRLTGMAAIPPAAFPFLRAEINFDLRFDDVIEIGPNHLWTAGQQELGPTPIFYSIGGFTNSGGVQTSNQAPAMGPGKIKKLISYFGVVTAGGTVIRRHILNGSGTAIIPNVNPSAGSIHEVALDIPFVKDDIIGFSNQQVGGGSIRHITQIELEHSAIELWGYGSFMGLGQGITLFGSMFGQISSTSLTVRANWQRSLDKGGIINDIIYYGTAPAGTGSSIISIEVNGVSLFDSPNLSVHNGTAIDRFDGVNIPFNAGDLLNVKTIGRVGTDGQGFCAVRMTLF